MLIAENTKRHRMKASDDGELFLTNFSRVNPDKLACFIAGTGNHFLDYGIVEGSLLLTEFGRKPRAGDLVVVGTPQESAIRLFREEGTVEEKGCPVANDEDHIMAVIIGAFNLYQ